MPGILRNGLALGWGLAEAIIFFIVPDVLLSWFALEDLRRALVACLYALLGAIIGGSIVWLLASSNPEMLRSLYASLPAIDSGMISDVRAQLQAGGLSAVLLAPLGGTPYKLYALEAADLHLSYFAFAAISIPARLLRFALVALAVSGLNSALRTRLRLPWRRVLLIVFWVLFYAWYFHVMAAA